MCVNNLSCCTASTSWESNLRYHLNSSEPRTWTRQQCRVLDASAVIMCPWPFTIWPQNLISSSLSQDAPMTTVWIKPINRLLEISWKHIVSDTQANGQTDTRNHRLRQAKHIASGAYFVSGRGLKIQFPTWISTDYTYFNMPVPQKKEPDRQWRSSSFQESKKVRVSRDLWPWPWAHPGCRLTCWPSCASLVAMGPFAWENKRFSCQHKSARITWPLTLTLSTPWMHADLESILWKFEVHLVKVWWQSGHLPGRRSILRKSLQTDGQTDRLTDRRRTPRHCISSFLEWAKNVYIFMFLAVNSKQNFSIPGISCW